MAKTTKDPKEKYSDLQQQLRGAELKAREAELHVQKLQVQIDRLTNAFPEVVASYGSGSAEA